jgi:hypothetical protein
MSSEYFPSIRTMELFQVHIVYSLNGNRNSLFGAPVMNFADKLTLS